MNSRKKNTFKNKKKGPRRAAASRLGRGWCLHWIGVLEVGWAQRTAQETSLCVLRPVQAAGGSGARGERCGGAGNPHVSALRALSPSLAGPHHHMASCVLRSPGFEVWWCGSWGEARGELGHFVVAGSPG